MKKAKRYTVLSLFSGGMGLDLGMESTGRFKLLATVEKEKVFCDTARLNQKKGLVGRDVKIIEGDISSIDPKRLMRDLGMKPGELDVIVGGPPCQAFSTAGKRASVQDPRGTLLWQYLRFVEAFKPKMFLMENVRGLLSAALKHRPISKRPEKGGPPLSPEEMPGSVVSLFAKDLRALDGAKYRVDCFEVNSVNYGAPQIRERALFFGNRFNAVIDFPEPTHGPLVEDDSTGELDLGLATNFKPWATLRDAIGRINDPNPEVCDFSPRKKSYLKMIPEGGNWRCLPEEMQRESMGGAWHAKGGRSGWWRRLNFELPCPTLVTMPNHASTSLCHPVETRTLTVREYAAVQEFPDNWEFAGNAADKYKQIGNAVPTRLGKVAGEVLAKALDALDARGWKKYTATDSDFRTVYINSHVRTRQWFKDGEAVIWDVGSPGAKKASRTHKRKLKKALK